MTLLNQITFAVKSTIEEKKRDFEYRRILNTKFASAALRPCLPFPQKSWRNTIIAEVKMNSPTKGRLAKDGETPTSIASQYIEGGAEALSVLTEAIYFEGDLTHLEDIRTVSESTPLLMKDFVLDKIQIQEARAYGADGVLLISHLIEDQLKEFLGYTKSLGMWALVETHSKRDINVALEYGADIIGVNNRDLKSSEVNLDKSVELSRFIPEYKKFVVESGISYPEDIRYLKENCKRRPDAYLVGTSLMAASDRKSKVRELVDA